MERWILSGGVLVVLGVIAAVAYNDDVDVPDPLSEAAPQARSVEATAEPEAPSAPVEIPRAEAGPTKAPASEKPVPETPEGREGIPRPDVWSEKTLAGTTWEAEGFDFAFGKDGTWHMAGRAASKWRVVGDRIKLFNDKGEVHYLDIVGDELMLQGKPVGVPVARN